MNPPDNRIAICACAAGKTFHSQIESVLVSDQPKKPQPSNPSWFNDKTDCFAVVYLPSGERPTYIVAAYRIRNCVLECIPRNPQDGSVCETKSLLFGTCIEIRNGSGLEHNVDLFQEIEEKIASKLAMDEAWRKADNHG